MNTLEKEGPDLIVHQFNERGDCPEPERISVPVPKGCHCELRLAQNADGAWHVGYHMAAGKEGAINVYPSVNVIGYDNRPAALDASLRVARDFFEASPRSKLHRKCAGEVHAFGLALGGPVNSSPANKKPVAKIPLPEPQNLDVAVDRLEPNPHNPRGEIDLKAEDIGALADTIATVGLLQAVGVRIIAVDGALSGIAGDNRLQLLWGHRRAAAFKRLKRATIPARVYEGISDEQARLLLLIENGQQKQLDPVQEARGYSEMARDFDMSQEEIAQAVKKSRPVVANALRLLELPAAVQDLLAQGKLTIAHGTALCRFNQWPKVCEKIADLAVENKSSAGSLEKDLPFAEELADAKLAVQMLDYDNDIDFDELKKAHRKDPAFFIWSDKDHYDDFAYCLDVKRGNQLIEEAAEKSKLQEERQEARESGRTGPGLSPAEKRERQKKLTENLTNRLQTSSMEHAAFARAKMVDEIDIPALYVVVAEAFSHSGGYGYEFDDDAAKLLGIKLPKGFDGSEIASVIQLKPADALRLAAICLAHRDGEDAMRNAREVPDYVDMMVRERSTDSLDKPSYVCEWHDKILPLVQAGKKAVEVQTELGCPEFIAVQMVRSIRREIREANEKPAPKPKAVKKPAKKKTKK